MILTFRSRSVKGRLVTLLAALVCLSSCVRPSPFAQSQSMPQPQPQYETRSIGSALVHVVAVPPGWTVEPALVPTVATLPQFKAQHRDAIAMINAGFFDPNNQKTTSYVTIQGKLVADPQTNDRLTQNPSLKPYLSQIWNRSEFRHAVCAGKPVYTIEPHLTPLPSDCQLVAAVGAGPQLLPSLNDRLEAFSDPLTGRDPIGMTQPNARSAIGLAEDGRIWLVMVAQTKSTGGVTLPQLAQILQSLGATRALNLDGGTSSALWYGGKTYLGKRDGAGNAIGRPVKSVIVVR